MKKTIILAPLALLTVLSVSPAVHAMESERAGLSEKTQVGISLGASSTDQDRDDDKDISVSITSTSSVDADNDHGTSSNSIEGSESSKFELKGDDARSLTNLDLSISSPMAVQSESNLKMYAQVLAHNDATISNVSSSNDTVEVTFRRPAKLFGFIPVNLSEKAQVKVDDQGKVNVETHKPWWSFLTTNSLKSDTFSDEIKAHVNAMGSFSANSSLSASAKAKMLDYIHNASNAVYGASIESNTTASTSVSY